MTRSRGHAASRASMGWMRSLVAGLSRRRNGRASAPPTDALGCDGADPDTAWLPTIQTPASDAPDTAPDAPPSSLAAKARLQYAITSDHAPKPIAPYPDASALQGVNHWGPHTWRQIEWRRQLVVVAGLFRQVGFEPRSQRTVGLTGADVLLASGNGQLLLRFAATRAGVSLSDMQAFARARHARGLPHATYATSGCVSDRARAYAREHRIHTLDGAQLLALIATRTPEQQDSLLEAAYAGAYWRPSCIRCGIKLTAKLRAADHRPQWTCRNAPRCTVTLPMDMAQLSAHDRPVRAAAPAKQADFVDAAYASTAPTPLLGPLRPSMDDE